MASLPATAQITLGELLEKGGVKVTRESYLETLPLTRKTIWGDKSGEATLTYQRDGTFSGTATHYSSRSDSPSVGKWYFDDSGQWCIDETLVVWNKSFRECFFRYTLAGDNYVSRTDKDLTSKILKLPK
jgi:hypothetical protein